jgi:hemerythrin-like domain-containing protein
MENYEDNKLEVSAVEDLMKEHGILNRLLLIYEKFIDQINNKQKLNKKIVLASALLIRKFIEDYHEKTEETYVFPKIKHINQKLIEELIKQHRKSNELTDKIIELSKVDGDSNLDELKNNLKSFVYMYRYHESREDTEVFVWFKNSFQNKKEYEEMGWLLVT